eukprot:TRINITY_DN4366_c0_g2_i1.p4 TRINITY_DN4366_c0_g2~~TRINITY_DN4366_c0_g2_i1.p4  ORF type:complete len:113 (+),score=30.21 TRINITY_DN4366_c0_g2_i1:452-790(+)
MGVLQGFSPLGIIIGYGATGVIVNNIDNKRAWRLSVFLQGICEIIPCILIMFFENEEIDILAKEKYSTTEKKYLDNDNDNKEGNPKAIIFKITSLLSFLKQFKELSKNSIYR